MDLIVKGWSIYTKCKSHPEVFYKISRPQNFAKNYQKKRVSQSPVKKDASTETAIFQKEIPTQVCGLWILQNFWKNSFAEHIRVQKKKSQDSWVCKGKIPWVTE